MGSILPASRPHISLAWAQDIAKAAGCTADTFILGRRGYYKETMNASRANDRGLYDDAIAIVRPNLLTAFNANTDPSRFGGKLAQLACGVWPYKIGTHHPTAPSAYKCLVQAAPVTVHRDNGVIETGEFYIHIHRGGYSTTGSEGCQTIHPEQWNEFMGEVATLLSKAKSLTIPYVLTEFT